MAVKKSQGNLITWFFYKPVIFTFSFAAVLVVNPWNSFQLFSADITWEIYLFMLSPAIFYHRGLAISIINQRFNFSLVNGYYDAAIACTIFFKWNDKHALSFTINMPACFLCIIIHRWFQKNCAPGFSTICKSFKGSNCNSMCNNSTASIASLLGYCATIEHKFFKYPIIADP